MNWIKKALLLGIAALALSGISKAQCQLISTTNSAAVATPTVAYGATATNTVTVRGSGTGPFGWTAGYKSSGYPVPAWPLDNYQFASTPVTGNFTETARLDSLSTGGLNPSTSLMAQPAYAVQTNPIKLENPYVGLKYYVVSGQAYVSFIYYTSYLEPKTLPRVFTYQEEVLSTVEVSSGLIYLELSRTSGVYTASFSYNNVTWQAIASTSAPNSTDPTNLGLEVDSGDNVTLTTATYDMVTISNNGGPSYYPYSQEFGTGLVSADAAALGGPAGSAAPQNNFIEGLSVQVQATPSVNSQGCTPSQLTTLQTQLASIVYSQANAIANVFDPNTLDNPTLITCAPGTCPFGTGAGNEVPFAQASTVNFNVSIGDSLAPSYQFANNISYWSTFYDGNHNLVFTGASTQLPPSDTPGSCNIDTFVCAPTYIEFAQTMTFESGTPTGGPGAWSIPVSSVCTVATTPPDHNPKIVLSVWPPVETYFFNGAMLFRLSIKSPWIDLPGFWQPGVKPPALGWPCTKNK